ncbi:MAG: YdeI/OmpD-associated family protein [Saprospiraceae bacterium]|nr:YdeI/OmpD-associated family protein [Candidatus Defluviibacterium haderslevense]
MQKKEIETFYPTNRQEWRQWLLENHNKKQSIWLVHYNKKSNMPSVSWSDAVDEALCFGWIDSTRKSLEIDKFIQFFTKRKPTSVWSKINKEKIERLKQEGLLMPAGQESISIAQQNGTWNILDDVEELEISEDLEKEFNTREGSKEYFLSLSKSVKKSMLQWIKLAKRPETRQKRIVELVEHANRKIRPKQFDIGFVIHT